MTLRRQELFRVGALVKEESKESFLPSKEQAKNTQRHAKTTRRSYLLLREDCFDRSLHTLNLRPAKTTRGEREGERKADRKQDVRDTSDADDTAERESGWRGRGTASTPLTQQARRGYNILQYNRRERGHHERGITKREALCYCSINRRH